MLAGLYRMAVVHKFLFGLFVLIPVSERAFCQQATIKTDTTKIYEDIQSYAKRGKVTNFMYQMIFKPFGKSSVKKNEKRKAYYKLKQQPYSTFEGKIIRDIKIITLDPFGTPVNDTVAASGNFLYRAGNAMHVKTQGIAIMNLLLFSRGKPFKALNVRESERLIRSQKYVQEVSFFVAAAGQNSDSVDIIIHESDKWSIVPMGNVTTSGFSITLVDRNFLGMGHEFQNTYSRNFTRNIGSFGTDYYIPNIRNSYIGTRLHYGLDGYGNFIKSIAVDRPFYSPLTKWAAGAAVFSESKKDSIKDINSLYIPMNHKFNTQDFWIGKAFNIFGVTAKDELVTNLILTARFLRIRYFEKPPELNDPLHIYSNENFYLAGVGISAREYVRDKYVFKFGVVEDVPVGKVYALTGGYQAKENSGRYYLGMQFSTGNYHKWGYLSSDIEYGTYFNSSKAEQGVISASANYFTGLIEMGKWKFRQFVKPQVIIGMKRFSYDSLTLKDGYGLNGFNSFGLSGTNRLLLTLQSQAYCPWNFFGFHLGPYLSCSLGMLGDAGNGFKGSKVYSQLGFGVLIKNENLVFNTFQISVSFYPTIPGSGNNVFKFNSFRTTDFGFRDFQIGKPAPVLYR
jgi:hypothetical protein